MRSRDVVSAAVCRFGAEKFVESPTRSQIGTCGTRRRLQECRRLSSEQVRCPWRGAEGAEGAVRARRSWVCASPSGHGRPLPGRRDFGTGEAENRSNAYIRVLWFSGDDRAARTQRSASSVIGIMRSVNRRGAERRETPCTRSTGAARADRRRGERRGLSAAHATPRPAQSGRCAKAARTSARSSPDGSSRAIRRHACVHVERCAPSTARAISTAAR